MLHNAKVSLVSQIIFLLHLMALDALFAYLVSCEGTGRG